MAGTEDQFVEQYQTEINKPYYIPTIAEIKDNPALKKAVDFVKQSLVGKLLAFIAIVVIVGILGLTLYGMKQMDWDEWKMFLAILAVPSISVAIVWFVA